MPEINEKDQNTYRVPWRIMLAVNLAMIFVLIPAFITDVGSRLLAAIACMILILVPISLAQDDGRLRRQ